MRSSTSPSVDAGDFVVGEIPDPIVYQFLDANGDPTMDLTGYTVKYVVRERWGSATTYDGDFEDATLGIVRYIFVGGEFPTAGEYITSFWVGNGTNRYASWKILYTVRLPVGLVPAI